MMPDNLLTIVAAAITVSGAVVTSVLTYRATRKRDRTTDALTERRDTLADRDKLIDTLTIRVDGLEDRLGMAEKEIKEVRNHNNALTVFIYKLLAVFRRHNLNDEIDPRDVPDGIHI